MFSKLKQFKDLRDESKRLQGELARETEHVDELDGKLQLLIDGNIEVLSMEVDESLLAPEHKEKIEKGLENLFNKAVKKIQRKVAMKMQKEGNLDLGSLLKKKE